MGVRLLILLGLLIGVLYCIHLLAKDYQAVFGSRLLRFLFKRDMGSENQSKPNVRWRKILQYDPIQCARFLYCDFGAHPPDNEIRRNFIFMLSLEPREEDRSAHEEFQKAYEYGRQYVHQCRKEYPMCPFKPSLLFELVQYLLRNPK